MPSTLRVVHVSSSARAADLGVLPGTPYLIESNGSSAGHPRCLNTWWTHGFRASLYDALSWMTDPPDPCSLREHGWEARDYCRAAGVGLAMFAREEIGLGLDLVDSLAERPDASVTIVTDNLTGARLASVARDVTRVTGARVRITARPSDGGKLGPAFALARGPGALRALETVGRAGTRLFGRLSEGSVSLPGTSRSTEGHGPAVGFYESGSWGWPHVYPVLSALTERDVRIVPIVASRSDGKKVWEQTGVAPLDVPRARLSLRRRNEILRAVDRMPVDLPSDMSAHPEVAKALIRRIVRRRLAPWLGKMQAAIEAARAACAAGVDATFQYGHMSPASRAFMLSAQAQGAWTFTTPEGLPDVTAPEHGLAIPADGMLAWGSSSVGTFEPAGEVIVAGNAVVERRLQAVAKQRSADGAHRGMVLIAFGRPGRVVGPELFASAIRLVAAAAQRLPHLRFVANIHPGDKPAFWENAMRDMGRDVPIELLSGRIYELLASADALITMHSTTGGEAAWLDIPVISVGGHIDPSTGHRSETELVPDYVAKGAAYEVGSTDELCATVTHIVNADRGRDRLALHRRAYGDAFLHRSPAGQTGAERMADAISAALDRGPRRCPRH